MPPRQTEPAKAVAGQSAWSCATVDCPPSSLFREVNRMRIRWIDRIRKNHSLEHATVARLLERGTSPPTGGYSLPGGFVIWAKTSPEVVTDAAREALRLLRDGHSDLAVSAYCGTNFVVAAVLGGIAASIAGRGRGLWPLIRGAAAGIIVASTFGKPVGKLLQRRLTVDSDPDGTEIRAARVLKRTPISIVWISTAMPRTYS